MANDCARFGAKRAAIRRQASRGLQPARIPKCLSSHHLSAGWRFFAHDRIVINNAVDREPTMGRTCLISLTIPARTETRRLGSGRSGFPPCERGRSSGLFTRRRSMLDPAGSTRRGPRRRTWIASACLLVTFGILVRLGPSRGWAQPPRPPVIPEDVPESYLIDNITRLAPTPIPGVPIELELTLHGSEKQELLAYVDALLEHYPQSPFRRQALIIKLQTLAQLARGRPDYLQQLLSLTGEISSGNPRGELASENAFYAIQGFVLGARYEGMPERQRIQGTVERYEAFLQDHPDSRHWPVISASLIRSLIATNRVDRAKEESARLSRRYPTHPAARQAQGELYAATAVGKPFAFTHTTPAGQTLTAGEYQGKVLVLHFWASRDLSLSYEIPQFLKLNAEFAAQGLQLISINLDRERPRAEEVLKTFPMGWPQFFEPRGRHRAGLVERGVMRTPTYFVVDRKGVLRYCGRGGEWQGKVKAERPGSPANAEREGPHANAEREGSQANAERGPAQQKPATPPDPGENLRALVVTLLAEPSATGE